jgi:ATP-dependent RNA helicase RhlE
MKFEEFGIENGILRSIQKLDYKKPTDIQYKAIRPVLRGEDVLAIAQTGTGKTAAFAIPVLHLLQKRKIEKRPDGVKCLVMAPTHELALQLTDVFNSLGKHTSLNIFCIHGGVEQDPQIAKLQKGIDILVATPGRLFDLVSQGYLRLNRVEILVLDEADHMLDLGFIKDIKDLVTHLPKKRQTLFFSATIDKKIKKLAYSLVSNPIRIQISPKNPVARNVDHSVAFIEMDDKRYFLERLVKENQGQKILVFVRTKIRAERVKKAMNRLEISSFTLHSDKDQKERNYSLDNFRNGKVKMLIATDITARGIDIPDVDFVVNYDLPEQPENYVHRVGRTGRGRQKGKAISFCSIDETSLLSSIQDYIGNAIKQVEIDKSSYRETLENAGEKEGDWESLLKKAEEMEQKSSRKRRKKKS